MQKTSMTMEEKTLEALDKIARREGRSRSKQAERYIREGIERDKEEPDARTDD